MSTRHGRPLPQPDEGAALPYVFLLSILLFLLVGALALWQVTAARPARNVIEAGIVTLTGIDKVLAENERELRDLARASDATSFAIPGYPLPVFLARDEVLQVSTPELRELVLERSSAIVYTEGLDAFDRTGDQSLSDFSSEGLLQLAVGQLTQDSHNRAGLVVSALAVLSGVAALAVVFKSRGYRRVTALGVAALPAGLIGIGVTLAATWIEGKVAGDDAFGRDLRAIADAVMDVPLRDFAILAGVGVLTIVVGLLFSFADRRLPAPAGATFAGAYDDGEPDDFDDD